MVGRAIAQGRKTEKTLQILGTLARRIHWTGTKMLVVCSQALYAITLFNPYMVVVILYFIKMFFSSIWGFTVSYRRNKEQFKRDIKETVLTPFSPALRYSIAGQKMYSHAGAPFYLIASALVIGIKYTFFI